MMKIILDCSPRHKLCIRTANALIINKIHNDYTLVKFEFPCSFSHFKKTDGINMSVNIVILTSRGVIHIKMHLHFHGVKGRAALFHQFIQTQLYKSH